MGVAVWVSRMGGRGCMSVCMYVATYVGGCNAFTQVGACKRIT